jgi:two-component system OmpR family sensor kinase
VRLPGLRLRGRLTLLIAVIVIAAGTITFVAVYRGTGATLRGDVEKDLRDQVGVLASRVAEARSPSDAATRARRYITAQPFSATSRLLIVEVPGRPLATNEPEVLGEEGDPGGESAEAKEREHEQIRALRSAAPGLSTVDVEDVGELRLLTREVPVRGGRPAVVRAGEPLASVERAQDGVARTFLVAGSLTLLVALIAGYLVAARVSAPLRRIARTAAQVDAGDLSRRIGADGPRDEVRALAESFDHMLDRLEEAFAGQRAFVADASHELRTPLTVVRGQLEVLARQEDPAPEEIRRVERQVTEEIVRMQRLVDDLLLLARGDEGFRPRIQPIELRAFVHDLVDGLAATADRRFAVGPLPDITVDGDPQLLAQVLRNLLRNAVEHTAPNGIVSVAATTGDGRLTISVDDDGPGIEASEREKVFDRFHRTDAARSRAGGGSGLGLAIARTIVEAHGGRIWAEASPQGGARVAVEIPLSTADPERLATD